MPSINNNVHTKELKAEKKFSVTANGNFFASDKRLIDKFYTPFIEQKSYNTKLNQGIGEIKKLTRSSALMNHYLAKKKKEIDNVADELIIFNNPSKIKLLNLNRY
jgi:hypothetical protein